MFEDLRLSICVLRAQKPPGGLMDKPSVQQSVACIKTFYPIFRIAIIMLLTAILVAQYCAPPPPTAKLRCCIYLLALPADLACC